MRGPQASLPLWTGFHANASSGYSWVAGDASSAYLYEVRATASAGAGPRAFLVGASGSGQIGFDYRRERALPIDLDAGLRDQTIVGSGGAPFPIGSFGVSVVPVERQGAARGRFATQPSAYAGGGFAYGAAQPTRQSRLDAAMLSATLQGNPFLSGGHPFPAVDAVPAGWTSGGDLR